MTEAPKPGVADRTANKTLGATALELAVWLWALRANGELIVADIDSTWQFPLDKGPPAHFAVRCNLSLTLTSFLIKPMPLVVPEPGTLFDVYASSPYSPTNYLSACATDEAGRFTRIWIDNHPSRRLGDPLWHLVRLAYVPLGHFEPAFSPNDYFYLPMETMGYEPPELQFEARLVTNQARRLVQSVAAYSPHYVPLGRGRREKFRGSPRRLLWEFEVTGWTNIGGRLYASHFAYKRYLSVLDRIDQDNLEPVALSRGRLVQVRANGVESITEMLAQQLEVADFRPSAELGGEAVVYQVTNGVWFAEDSPELAALVSAKQRELVLRPRLTNRAARQSRGPLVAFGALLLAPVTFLALRWVVAKRRQRLTREQQWNR